jgi:hypothetical protein
VAITSVLAASSPFPFSISGFNGLTIAQIISFVIVFVIFNGYVVLMAAALAAFYVTSKPRHGRVRTAAIWHFVATLFVLLAFISTVWGAPAEKSFVDRSAHNLSLDQSANITIGGLSLGRAGMLFVGMFFAAIAVLCMLIGFVKGAAQKRALREEAFAA